jgi:NADH dehydrogenase FAD-containing subunit
MTSTVAIYGAGIAGAILASRLAGDFDVTLVAPTDYFEVPMAMPRLAVRPALADKAVISIAEALPKVDHVRGRLAELTPAGGLVDTADGTRRMIAGDITVLATGSRFTSSLMRPLAGSMMERRAIFHRLTASLAAAQRIVVVGGGPIGVEIAAEIVETWPGRSVTMSSRAFLVGRPNRWRLTPQNSWNVEGS